jgi:predicted Ser/Thr protein kinase/phage FluMu protein Com
MPQTYRCPHCSKPLQVPDDALGKPLRCPTCKQLFSIRAPVRQPAAAAPAKAAPPPPPVSRSAAAVCPICRAPLAPGASACLECGYLAQSDSTPDVDGLPSLCANPACGVANPPNERLCQRCGTPLPTAPGTVLLGRYRIERLLAMGGFGAVYLASDLRQGNQPVAIKDMIGADPQEFAIRLNFFRREAEILRLLQGLPAVPRLIDYHEQGQVAHLVLEYIRGQDLLKLLEQNKNQPFSFERVVEWGQSVCDVLTHMHSQTPPIVHRDLKPDNIMLLDDQRSIKLIDFGTARDVGRSQKTQLAAKTRVYTEGYAPPEQIIGKPEPRSDLFALAGTLYHLLTGKAPEGYYTARELEAELAQANGPYRPEQRWLFELLRINLAEDVNDRYFSAAEFKADLERRRVTREVACPKCQAVNGVRQPYCVQCAEPLTDAAAPCHHCGQVNRLGSRCCIYCGNRLR